MLTRKLSTSFIFTIIYTLIIVERVKCGNILAMFCCPLKSHMIVIDPIIDGLLQRGHNVTSVTNISRNISMENYREIYIKPNDFWAKVKNLNKFGNLIELQKYGVTKTIQASSSIGDVCTENCFANPKIQELYNSNDNQFDLILMDQFNQEALLIFAHKLNLPVVYITTLSSWQYLSQIMGYMQPWAHIPHQFLKYDDKMNFAQRCINVWTSLYELYYRYFYSYPNKESLIQKYLIQSNEPFPSIREMEKRVSLVLVNGYTPLNFPGPKPSGIVEIGGIQIKDVKPLTGEVREFLDGAEHGAIYFSFGTNVKQSDLSEDKYKSLLKTLGELKQRILWKWKTTSTEPIPKNIMMKTWFPQNDILAHKNLQLFISHGGLLSVQETVYRGVPVIAVPFFGDHYTVAEAIKKGGYGLYITFNNFTDNSLKWGINEILGNPSYKNEIQKLSNIFRDRPRPAIDEATYWIEYVIRHKGASHLKLASKDLNWFNYFLLDIIGVFILLIIIVFLLFWSIVCNLKNFILNKCRKSLNMNNNEKRIKKNK